MLSDHTLSFLAPLPFALHTQRLLKQSTAYLSHSSVMVVGIPCLLVFMLVEFSDLLCCILAWHGTSRTWICISTVPYLIN